jgi:hypothetical protein
MIFGSRPCAFILRRGVVARIKDFAVVVALPEGNAAVCPFLKSGQTTALHQLRHDLICKRKKTDGLLVDREKAHPQGFP